MKVLLVYPEYPDTFWSFKHVLHFVGKKAGMPPLGLLTVAAMLPEEWDKKLIDINITNLKDEDIAWADTVFISAMIVQIESAKAVIKKCMGHKKKIVCGGPGFTPDHQNIEGVDHFVLNEAEITLPLFLRDLEAGSPKPVYSSNERPDITKTPIPLWSLIKFRDYNTMAIQYSRGCPYDCEFCDIVIMNGRIPRTKNPKQLISEVESLKTAGYKGSIFIVDDNFIGNKERVKTLLRELILWQKDHHYPYTFLTEASINLADDEELMDLMSAANFHKVFLGLETPDPGSLKECGKMQNTRRDLAESVKIIHQHGMQVMGGFIVGFDNDNETVFDVQRQFIQKIGVVTAMIGTLTALPETRLWHRLKSEGRLIASSSGENMDGAVNFIPKMGVENLIRGYKKLLKSIYSRKNYYARIHIFIRDYRPTSKARLSTASLRAFFMSIWEIGVKSKARFHYWKLLGKTSLTKPRSFPIAVELAIYGVHFEKMADRIAD